MLKNKREALRVLYNLKAINKIILLIRIKNHKTPKKSKENKKNNKSLKSVAVVPVLVTVINNNLWIKLLNVLLKRYKI